MPFKPVRYLVIIAVLSCPLIQTVYGGDSPASASPNQNIPSLDVSADQNPELAYSNCGLGEISLMQHEFDQAIEHLSECIQYSPPGYTQGYYLRSLAYMGKSKISEKKSEQKALQRKAISDLDQLIEYDTEDLEAYKERSKIFSELGDHEKALTDLQKANELYQKQHGSSDIILESGIERLKEEAK